MKLKRLLAAALLVLFLPASVGLAHPGRTDSNGGHWNHSTGTYHYHNGGGSSGSSGKSSSSSGSSGKSSSSKAAKPMIYPDASDGLLTTANVNMRNGAGTSYSIITTLPVGTAITYAGKTSGRRHYVKYKTTYGWIYNDYLKIDPSRPAPTQEPYLETVASAAKEDLTASSSKWEGASTMLTFEFGFLICIAGLIATIIIAVRITKSQIRDAKASAYGLVATARAEADHVKADTARQLEALEAKHQAEMKERRELQLNLLKTRSIVKAIEADAAPDFSEGIVFVRPDLSLGAYYHHVPTCTSELSSVLITKTAAKRLSMIQCPQCCDREQPEYDISVYISKSNYSIMQEGTQPSKTIVYHRANCRHLKQSFYGSDNARKVTLSELKNSGYQTSMCADCTPPLFNPKVWF